MRLVDLYRLRDDAAAAGRARAGRPRDPCASRRSSPTRPRWAWRAVELAGVQSGAFTLTLVGGLALSAAGAVPDAEVARLDELRADMLAPSRGRGWLRGVNAARPHGAAAV